MFAWKAKLAENPAITSGPVEVMKSVPPAVTGGSVPKSTRDPLASYHKAGTSRIFEAFI